MDQDGCIIAQAAFLDLMTEMNDKSEDIWVYAEGVGSEVREGFGLAPGE